MSNSIFTKLASILTIIFFLGNDLMASVGAFHRLEMIEIAKYTNSKKYSDAVGLTTSTTQAKPLPKVQPSKPIDPIILPDLFTNRAANKSAFIGAHHLDPLGSPSDDVFSIDLQDQIQNYEFAYLQYEVKGIANAEELPKAINGGEVYVGGELKASDTWQRVTVMVDYEDLKEGNNQVRFALSKSSELAAEVKNVQIHLTSKPRAVNKGLKMKRQMADEKDFKLLVSSENALTFKNKDLEMASIPKSIRNLTRNAMGYGLRNNANEVVKVAIGVNALKLNSPNDLKEANVFYYNTEDNSWKKAHTEKVDMANLVLEASVPPNTDYFAGMIKSPDMPEASAFVPTGISGIEAANPAAGMNLMTPPSQSKMGDASFSYPLEIPQGRKGLTPQLNLNYNSRSGTGPLGVGWDLALGSIEIDTKWGVPAFPTDFQEEVYSFNGQTLVQQGGTKGNRAKPFNGQLLKSPRLPGVVRFFPHVMSSYATIERKGDTPAEYIWVKTTADKTKYYYGTLNGETVEGTAVLNDIYGNIVKWFLTKIEDQWGNNITYTYSKNQHFVSSNSSLVELKDGGWTIIPYKINYSGHYQTEGNYEVEFVYSNNRPDATISMRFGFKVLDDHELEEIVVRYLDSPAKQIKKFVFDIQDGDFLKRLLSEVVEYRGTNTTAFYRHSMEYYSKGLSYSPEERISGEEKGSTFYSSLIGTEGLDFLTNPVGLIFYPSLIKTTSTTGWSAGGALGVGLGPLKIFDKKHGKKFTFSGLYNHSETKKRDHINLRDMNGDGLPDVIYDKKHTNGYLPLTNNNGEYSMGEFIEIETDYRLYESNSSSNSYGFDYSLGDAFFYAGWNWNYTDNEVIQYLNDYNGDGFPDLVVPNGDGNSKVHFGTVDDVGKYQFLTNSSTTPAPVLKEVALSQVVIENPINKDIEIVKSWVAPFDGTINITGVAESFSQLDGETRVAIQKNRDFVSSGFSVVDYQNSLTTNYSGIEVEKGDILLFRTKSALNGQEDLIVWNPEIDYSTNSFSDGNDIDYGNSAYEDAFILSGNDFIEMVGNQKIKIDLNRSVSGPLSDDVSFQIVVEVEDANNDIIDTRVYANDLAAGTTSFDNIFEPIEGAGALSNWSLAQGQTTAFVPNANSSYTYRLFFKIFSTSNVDWKKLKFRPNVTVDLDDCEYSTDLYPVVNIGTYNRVDKMSAKFPNQSQTMGSSNSYRIWPEFNFSGSDIDQIFDNQTGTGIENVFMTVKIGSNLISKLKLVFNQANSTLTFNSTNAHGENILAVTSSSDPSDYSFQQLVSNTDLYVEFFIDEGSFSEATKDFIESQLSELKLEEFEDEEWVEMDNSSSNYNIFRKEFSFTSDKILHWGQFSWSFENSLPEDEPILPEEIRPDIQDLVNNTDHAYDDSGLPDLSFFTTNEDQLNVLNHKFSMLVAQRGEKNYMLRDYQVASYDWLLNNNWLSSSVDNKAETLDRYSFRGLHIGVYASRGMTSPGKLGEVSTYSPNAPSFNDNSPYTANGSRILSRSKSQAKTTRLTPLIPGSFSVSESVLDSDKYFSRTLMQFQDFNGDGFPDRLREISGNQIKVAYTGPLGGHQPEKTLSVPLLSKTINDNETEAIAGTFANQDRRWNRNKGGDVTSGLQTNTSTNITGSRGSGTTVTDVEMVDVNGDGLPDRIVQGSIELNSGSSLLSPKPMAGWGISTKSQNGSITFGGNFSQLFTKISNFYKFRDALSYAIGISANIINNQGTMEYLDINGDGLVDRLQASGGNFTVHLNSGTGFQPISFAIAPGPEKMSQSYGAGFSAFGSGSYSHGIIEWIPLGLRLKINLSANGGLNYATDKQTSIFIDMNGDGVPDYVKKDAADLLVQYADIDKSNLLKRVINPLGGDFEIDYERVGNKRGFHKAEITTHLNQNEELLWDMPNSKWVMSKLIVHDNVDVPDPNNPNVNLDGADNLEVRFKYDGGIKSRRERKFLGFTRIEKLMPKSTSDVNRNEGYVGFYEYSSEVPDPGSPQHAQLIYLSQVTQFMAPVKNDFEYRKRTEYTNNLVTEQYSFYNKETLNNQTITKEQFPIEVNKFIYDFRNVDIDPGSESFNKLYPLELENSTVDFNEISETQTIFPSVVETISASYPDNLTIANRGKYFSRKYLIEYDDYWNVVRYEDAGTFDGRNLNSVIVDSYNTTKFEYSPPVTYNLLVEHPDPVLSDDLFYVYKIYYGPDPSFEPVYIYRLKPANPCWGFTIGEAFATSITAKHRKRVSTTVNVYGVNYQDTYTDKVIATMEYWDNGLANKRTNVLKVHKVYQNLVSDPNLKRHTEVSSLYLGKAANVIWNHLDATLKSQTDLSYDGYGNVTRIEGPANDNIPEERMALDYTYETDNNIYVINTSNSFGESTCSDFDYLTGNLEKSVDVNGHATRYVYDTEYRLKEVWAPKELYDQNSPATIKFEYHPEGVGTSIIPVAITHHNLARTLNPDIYNTPENSCGGTLTNLSGRDDLTGGLRTATFSDGLGRIIQVKKEAADANGTMVNGNVSQVSGWTSLDNWGSPQFIYNSTKDAAGTLEELFVNSPKKMMSTTYDYVGRSKTSITSVGLGLGGVYDEIYTKFDYDWRTFAGVEYIRSKVTKREGTYNGPKINSNVGLFDSRGRKRFSQQGSNTSPVYNITTEFIFNSLGEVTSTIDPLGEITTYQYDNFGRTIQEDHPDRGTSIFEFDGAGNLIAKKVPDGVSTFFTIDYEYDFNRLIGKSMPESGDLYDVEYIWSGGSNNNGTGRITSIVQGTTANPFKTEIFKYDELGNEVYESKTIDIPGVGDETFITENNYDSWGRILHMIYPDGERVTYNYLATGELHRIDNNNPYTNQLWITLDHMTYNGFGNIEYMEYGNGAETYFTYDSETRSMENVAQWAKNQAGGNLLKAYDQVFTYDNGGRIHGMEHNANTAITGLVDHDYSYTYDGFNRLTDVTGNIDGSGSNYTLTMTYNEAGGIVSKNQQSPATTNSYNLGYTYQSGGHKINKVDGKSYIYNEAGSITKIGSSETFLRNEEQLLVAVENSNGNHHYVYDHNGERIMKSTYTTSNTAFNGQGGTNTGVLDPYTVYVNPYYVTVPLPITDQIHTNKHYFMGSQRIATETVIYTLDGSGESGEGLGPEAENSEELGSTANPRGNSLQKNGLKKELDNENLVNPVLMDLAKILVKFGLKEGKDFKEADLKPVSSDNYYDQEAIDLWRQQNSMEGQNLGESSSGKAGDIYLRYWYHSNYLGNNEMITNENGEVHQYFVYSPFGENLYQWDKNTLYDNPYRFNGKEIDPETGNQYYGARYYDPKISVWLSVDPMSSARSWLTPYNFVQNNPVHRVDPTGMLDDGWVESLETCKYEWIDCAVTPETTPQGYRFVGMEDNDVLEDMGYKSESESVSSKSLATVTGGSGPGWVGTFNINLDVDLNIGITPSIGYDKSGITEDNKLGKVFNGISVTVSGNASSNYPKQLGKTSAHADVDVSAGYGKASTIIQRNNQSISSVQSHDYFGSTSILVTPNFARNSSQIDVNLSGGWTINGWSPHGPTALGALWTPSFNKSVSFKKK